MPETSTAINACDVSIHLEDGTGTGTLHDISGSSNSASLSFSQEIADYRVFGTRWKKRMVCAKDATLSLNVVYTTAQNEGLDLLRDWFFGANSNVARTVRIMVPNDEIGGDDYQGEFLISSMDIPLEADEAGPIMVSAELMPMGEVLYGTIAT